MYVDTDDLRYDLHEAETSVRAAREELEEKLKELEEIKNKYAKSLCRFSVGDRITDGFATILISDIYLGCGGDPKLVGYQVYKSGEISGTKTSIYWYKNWDWS